MQTYELTLQSDVSKTFRCQKAANSLDIDTEKKAVHHFKVAADVTEPYSIGLVVGASGSGKTTLVKSIYGKDCFKTLLDLSLPVIDQFPKQYSYDECATMLAGVGLTAVLCWIRPAFTLSNGQRARAEIALQMARPAGTPIVIDEWTSVVDRTVAKVMSLCILKHAQKTSKQIVLCSCHYDVEEWLQPDWVIDCNAQSYADWRGVRRSRKEKLDFQIRDVGRETWPYFSKYHYLSARLLGGHIENFGVFNGQNQIGFVCYANYVPTRKGHQRIMHANRVVVHPDFQGLGIGIHVFNETAKIMVDRGFSVMSKFSSTPVFKAMNRHPCWELQTIDRNLKTVVGEKMKRKKGFREKIKTYSFRYIGDNAEA